MAGSLREGIRLYRAKRWELALSELLQVDGTSLDREDVSDLAYFLGLSYTKLERYDDALLYLEQVVTAGADLRRARQCRMALALVYSITGRSRLAEFELNQLIGAGFESAQVYSTLAYAAWTQKQLDPAVDNYRKALRLEKENPNALNGLGYVLSDSEHNPRQGLSLCKKAVDLRPQNPAYLDSLGWAHFKLGDLPEARTWLRRALDIAPRHPDIASHMRVVLGETRQ